MQAPDTVKISLASCGVFLLWNIGFNHATCIFTSPGIPEKYDPEKGYRPNVAATEHDEELSEMIGALFRPEFWRTSILLFEENFKTRPPQLWARQ